MNNVNIIPYDALIVPIKSARMKVIEDQYDWFYIFNSFGHPTHVCVLDNTAGVLPKPKIPPFIEHNSELHYYFTKEFY